MRTMRARTGALTLALLVTLVVGGLTIGDAAVQAQDVPEMSFFITSEGLGDGANLGGLLAADQHCAILAARAGSRPNRTWRAYLSTQSRPQSTAINARDRIGTGPWYNAKGMMIAKNVDDLHSDHNMLGKEMSLNEKGEMVNGRGDTPNMHDMLTGSDTEGRAVDGDADTTCNNWQSNAGDGSALLGHHDKQGGGTNPNSWNSAHPSKGCSQANLQATGGNGLFYCFATD